MQTRSPRIRPALVALALLACGEAPAPEVHPARGRVVEVRRAGSEIVVDHEAVAGHMEAMRMTLAVADPAQARSLTRGDKIRFELVSDERGSYLRALSLLPPDTPLELPDEAGSTR
jgi:Cu/Ag efflux protein CusF